MNSFINIIKKLMFKLLMIWKRFNQNIEFNKKNKNSDLKYLSKDEIKETEEYWKKLTKNTI